MGRAPLWRRYLRFWRPDVQADVDDELRFHLEERVEDLVVRGVPADAARCQALEEFGDVASVRAGLEAIDRRVLERRGRAVRNRVAASEIRLAVRRLAWQPSFTIPALLTLALGLGAVVAIGAVLRTVVLSPLDYPAAERLVYLDSPVPGIGPGERWGVARHEQFYFKQQSRILEEMGVFRRSQLTVGGNEGRPAERATAVLASASLPAVLGFRPFLGRLFTAADNLRREPDVVVLGYRYWRRQFGGDSSIVGRTIPIEGFRRQVIGVLPPGADLPDATVDLWAPAWIDPASPAANNHVYLAFGRLKPGYTAADLERELAPLTARFPETFPEAYSSGFMRGTRFRTAVTSLRDRVVGEVVERTLWILFAAVGLVLVVAAANVVNLILVRCESRRREMAVRLALGARRVNLVTHLLTESLVLSIGAALLGLAFAAIGLEVMLALAPASIPRLASVRLGWPDGLFAVVLAVAAGGALALLPIRGLGTDARAVAEGSRRITLGRRQHAVRNGLAIGQISLAMLLLAAAGLLVESYLNLERVEPGFDPTGVAVVSISLPKARYQSDTAAAAFVRALGDRLAESPAVLAVGAGEQVPLGGPAGCTGVMVEAATRAERREACVTTLQVSPGYFAALGIRVKGRAPDWAETFGGAAGVVVSRALAAKLWPDRDPIGQGLRCCQYGPVHYRVVGITDDVRGDGLDGPPTQAAYFPLIAMPGAPLEGVPRYQQLVVRARNVDVDRIATAIRRTARELDPDVAVGALRSMSDVVARSLAGRSFALALLGIASGMALLLSAVGLYGVIAFLVGERRGEIGIRLALGARATAVGGMVVGQSIRLAVAGVVIGLAAASIVTRVLASLLFEVAPIDLPMLLAAAGCLVGIATVAGYLPARRAMRVDPAEALRPE